MLDAGAGESQRSQPVWLMVGRWLGWQGWPATGAHQPLPTSDIYKDDQQPSSTLLSRSVPRRVVLPAVSMTGRDC